MLTPFTFKGEMMINKNIIFIIVVGLLCIGLLFIDNGFVKDTSGIKVKAKILEIDNSNVSQYGLVKMGSQSLKIKILNGKYKNQETMAINQIKGKLELDTMYKVGDKVLVGISVKDDNIYYAIAIDHYRLNLEIILIGIFVLALIGYAGWTGVKAVLSFAFTAIVIWQILIPSFLKGYEPIAIALGVVALLSAVIIFLVAGITKKGFVAFLGAFSGIMFTAVIAQFFGDLFKINGAIKPFSETLLYSGYSDLDLTKILFATVFIAASGAVMDIAMDISASMSEVKEKDPDIDRKTLILSGFNVGRAVVGTMATTLLFAYSGSYMSLLMMFVAQGTPLIDIVNFKYVAAEILNTIVGSFGLVLVAPLTAIIGGFIYDKK